MIVHLFLQFYFANMNCEPFKRCRVCGDKAFGFNFDAVTCDSCKSFFRRHAIPSKIVRKCKHENNCPIDRHSRSKCISCRLRKCFQIGMRNDILCRNRLEMNSETDLATQQFKEFSPTVRNLATLKDVEFEILIELQNASSAFWNVQSCQVRGEAHDIVRICNLGAYTIRQTIKFCKSFAAFKQLNEQDQLILFKNFYPEKTTVRVAFRYDEQEDGFAALDSVENESVFVRLNAFRQFIDSDLYSILRQFVRLLHQKMENDTMIRDLILAILLFKFRFNINAHEYVQYHRILYSYILHRYLKHKYSDAEVATRKCSAILSLLKQIDHTSVAMRDVYNRVRQESNQLEQVLVEIYN